MRKMHLGRYWVGTWGTGGRAGLGTRWGTGGRAWVSIGSGMWGTGGRARVGTGWEILGKGGGWYWVGD